MVYLPVAIGWVMDPSSFFFIIVPLAAIIAILVGVILYKSRQEVDNYEAEMRKLRKLLLMGKLDRKTYLCMRNRLRQEHLFSVESKKLLSMLSDGKIDQETYVRLRHVLDSSHKEKLDQLDTEDGCDKEPFFAGKF